MNDPFTMYDVAEELERCRANLAKRIEERRLDGRYRVAFTGEPTKLCIERNQRDEAIRAAYQYAIELVKAIDN